MESKGRDVTQLSDTKWLRDLALLIDLNTEDTDGRHVLRHQCSDKIHNLIKKLREEFDHGFSDFRDHEKSFNLFQNPFSCVPEDEQKCSLSSSRPEQHIVTRTSSSSTKDFLHPVILHSANMLSE